MTTLNHLQLPDSLRDLIDHIGESAALRLIERRGGTYLCVPKNVNVEPGHLVLELLGPEAFTKLVDWYGGETIMLPKNDAVMRQVKRSMIRDMRYIQRMQIDQIALKTGYSMRWVFRVLAEDEIQQENGELF